MKIATIHGSARENGNNAKALAIFHDELSQAENVELIAIRPSQLKLAPPDMGTSTDKLLLQELVKSADGVLVNTPEFHGSFSSLIKMTIENMGYPSALSEKPVVMLGVAGGELGAIKSLEHLSSILRHTGALVLPKFVSVAQGDSVFDGSNPAILERIEGRIRGLAQELVAYVSKQMTQSMPFEMVVRGDDNK
jgi:FMN reductase